MKTIKFRAWCQGKHDNLTFGKAHMEYGVSIGGKGGYLGIESGWDIHGEYLTVPLMQFTGLKDKNGKEIYEGDIVIIKREYEGVEIVAFEHIIKDIRQLPKNFFGSTFKESEVIGNIYENPELMKNETKK